MAASLQLAKLTSQPLHFQWTAISSLWYKESLTEYVSTLQGIEKSLLPLLEKNNASSTVQLETSFLKVTNFKQTLDISQHITKLQQKISLLPRLAESLSSRMVLQQPSSSSSSERKKVVSENDWDVYIETLLDQDKLSEALEVLSTKIDCTPMIAAADNDDSKGPLLDNSTTALPQIDDEDTLQNHVGSMLPYTQRRKLERCAQLSLKLGLLDKAEGYYRELLHVFPDQWTYWMGLVRSSCVVDNNTSSPLSSINTEGWDRCQLYAKEVISRVEGSQKYALRGPYLILVELISLKVQVADHGAQSKEEDKDSSSSNMEGLVLTLRDEIVKYGNKFGPMASCCFADMKPYLGMLVKHASGAAAELNDIPKDIVTVLDWAKEMWTTNAQSSAESPLEVNVVSTDEFRERRKKIRSYIFAIHVIFSIASKMKNNIALQVLEMYAPSPSHLVTEWRTSLTSLPGVPPKDGGQKEVLPGDEIILLTSQYLLFQAARETDDDTSLLLLQTAGLVEEAIDHSPYNPHLKIAAMGVYSQLNAAHRALSIYEDMGVKQIQLDSCSYLILPTLIQGGLYTSAIKLASSILKLHGSTSKDIKDYASRSLQNGLMFKANEMVTFQRNKMRPSLQLLYSKGLIMDAAALMLPADLGRDAAGSGGKQRGKSPSVKLAEEKGFCGSEEDVSRAEQLAIDAEMHFNAPSVIHAAFQSAKVDDFLSSDNRDMSINYFALLYQNAHLTQKEMVSQSLRSGHMYGLLTRAIMAVGAANAPKKGKVPKLTEENKYQCESLRHCLSSARLFGQEEDVGMDDIDQTLWDACCQLCEIIISVIEGSGSIESDSLVEREKAATTIVNSTTQLIENARKAFALYFSDSNSRRGSRVCQLLPGHIVPFYTLVETAGRLFNLFGWGKRKHLTKAASGALANLALSLRNFISDMIQSMSHFRSFDGSGVVESATTTDLAGTDMIQKVLNEVAASRDMTKDRVDPFLVQMRDALDTYNKEES